MWEDNLISNRLQPWVKEEKMNESITVIEEADTMKSFSSTRSSEGELIAIKMSLSGRLALCGVR